MIDLEEEGVLGNFSADIQGPPMSESVAPSVRLPYKSSVFYTNFACAAARATVSFMEGPCIIKSCEREFASRIAHFAMVAGHIWVSLHLSQEVSLHLSKEVI
jgi:hypothetical protein